ncbi:MAG TPA: nitroreductase family protein [Candidatus Avirikenella pullistercoris]|nr:nitroreductase family protein [Candidatus Avirikenella pullistercoris]
MKNAFWVIPCLMVMGIVYSCSNQTNEMGKTENTTLTTIHNRKSVRSYTEQAVSQEDLTTLVKAGMAAPSGMDRRPWEFVIVTDREKLNAMADTLPYAKMLTSSPAAIVVCGNNDEGNGGSSYWYLDCSAATQNILLAAEAMGLGAVWTAAYPYEERMAPVKEILELPGYILPLSVIPVGYPNGEFKAKEKYNPAKIHTNKW